MKRELTCIICPRGCKISVDYEDGKILDIRGNSCPRGSQYAVSEITDPKRTITTTMLTNSGEMIPVKTDKPVSKDLVLTCMKEINTRRAKTPISIGDILIENILETGSNIIATKNMS